MRSNYFRSVPGWTVRLVVAVIVLTVPVEVTARCRVTVDLYTDQRRVPGEVNVECSEPHYSGGNPDKSKYEKGFGNWGVMSYYGATQNGFQFAGWYLEDNLLQWQSCTKKLPKPDCKAYNYNNCTGQMAVPDDKRRYGGYSYTLPYGVLCETIGIETVEEIDLHIVELDWPDGDDPVASLLVGDVDIPLSCTGGWSCSGHTAWIAVSSGAGTVSARVRAEATTEFWETR